MVGTQPDNGRIVGHRLFGLGEVFGQAHELRVGWDRQRCRRKFLRELLAVGVVDGNERGEQGGMLRRPLLAGDRHDVGDARGHAE